MDEGALRPHVAQNSAPRISTRKWTTVSGSTPCTAQALSSGMYPSSRSPYTSSPSACPCSIACLQCSSRSLPAGWSDQGRDPSRLGAQSRQLHPPAAECIESTHSAITTVPSDLRTPLQLVRRSSSHTPRVSKAFPREIRRRGLMRGPELARSWELRRGGALRSASLQ